MLDLDMSIRGNFMKKSLIEFPTILIVLRDHKYTFDIYDSGKGSICSVALLENISYSKHLGLLKINKFAI